MSVWGWDQTPPPNQKNKNKKKTKKKKNSGFFFLDKGKSVQKFSPVSLNDFIVDYAFCSLSEQVHFCILLSKHKKPYYNHNAKTSKASVTQVLCMWQRGPRPAFQW